MDFFHLTFLKNSKRNTFYPSININQKWIMITQKLKDQILFLILLKINNFLFIFIIILIKINIFFKIIIILIGVVTLKKIFLNNIKYIYLRLSIYYNLLILFVFIK